MADQARLFGYSQITFVEACNGSVEMQSSGSISTTLDIVICSAEMNHFLMAVLLRLQLIPYQYTYKIDLLLWYAYLNLQFTMLSGKTQLNAK